MAEVEIPLGTPLGGDAQDIVFIDDAHVLFIRLHLQLNGLGFRESWETFTDKFFDYADANGDGWLSPAEVSSAVRMLGVSTSAAAMDVSPKDGKVTKQEWTAGLARFGEAQFSANGQRNGLAFTANGALVAGGGSNPGSALWKLLDTNGDKLLTKEELAAAPRVLRKFDLDDDEMIAASELRPYDTNPYGQYFVADSSYNSMAAQADGPIVLVIPARGDVTPVAKQLLARLDGRDKAKDQKLSPKELPLPKEEFAAADANHDGLLDLEEIKQLLRDIGKNVIKPQLALVVRQGPEAGRRGKFALATVDGKPAPLVASLRGNPRGMLTLDVGTLQLQFTAADWNGPINYEQAYKQQFQQLDQDGNGYIDKKEAENSYIADQFAQMDRDRDGKVFLKEFVDYYRQQNEVALNRITLQGNDQGKLLFDLIDTNHDGRLSPRELAEAPAKLPQWDRNGDGKLEESEIPRQYTLNVGRGGNQGNVYPTPVAFGGGGRPTAPPPQGEPAWFIKMDRNRDGDVSRREFLGPAELFDRIDLNHDGRIDAAEAAKAAELK